VKNLSKQWKMKLAVAGILVASAAAGFARAKYETIDAQAYGTSTQMGKTTRISLIIYKMMAWRTPWKR
jgi:SpoU rRNA methylase family enzyme